MSTSTTPSPSNDMKSRILGFAVLGLVATALALVFAGVSLGPTGPDPGLDDVRVGSPAPDFTLRSMYSSEPVSLQDHAGKVVAIDFWATFCGPCRRSMPHLQQVYERLDAAEFALISVNVDAPTDNRAVRGERFVREQRLTFDLLVDTGRASYLYQASRIPLLVLVGRDGTIRRVYRGTTDPRFIDRALDELLAEPRPTVAL